MRTCLKNGLASGLLIASVLVATSSRSLWADERDALSDPYAHCPADHPLKRGNDLALLARGFNLPNWDPFYNGLKPDDALLIALKQQGLQHIRLPFDGEYLIAPYHDAETARNYLDQLDETVTRLVGLGFAVTVDMHPGGNFQKLHNRHPDRAYDQLQEIWQHVVDKGRNWPRNKVYFELLNEPTPPQDVWWPQAQKLVSWLNEADKGRRLVVGPAVFQRHEPLETATPLKGEHVIYAIHFYDPFLFTHQAMTWAEGSFMSRLKQLPFPGSIDNPAVQKQIKIFSKANDMDAVKEIRNAYAEPWNAARIKTELAAVAAWSDQHQKPVIINEFGVLDFDVDRFARTDWLRAVRAAAEGHCLGWAHWDFSDGFAMVNPNTTLPDALVLDALTAPRR
nr:cellulase family glycosylhydrolase [uncultured Cohaesibacter sp.]